MCESEAFFAPVLCVFWFSGLSIGFLGRKNKGLYMTKKKSWPNIRHKQNLRWLNMRMSWQGRGCRYYIKPFETSGFCFCQFSSLFWFSHFYCQAENEYHRVRNQELVKLQEDSSIRLEQTRLETEKHIQALRKQTIEEQAKLEHEKIRETALAKAVGRVDEIKQNEEINRRDQLVEGDLVREKWISIINTTFDHIGGTFFYQMQTIYYAISICWLECID